MEKLKLHNKAKRKDGQFLHKLPPPYPIIGEIEDKMKKNYNDIISNVFVKNVKRIIEEG